MSVEIGVPTSAAMQALGGRIAAVLRAGDLVVLAGSLGAGKTTLARGIGGGLDVRGSVTSPTFVIARVHPPMHEGPALVHVDAYRLGGDLEVDDLDLDASLDDAVTLVEWGEGVVERLAEDRLVVAIERPVATDGDQRVVTLTGVGRRWSGVDLHALAAPTAPGADG